MKEPQEILNSTRAGQIANPNPKTVSPSDLATHARKIFRTTGLHTLPVAENGKLVGVLKSGELLKITSTHSNIKVSGLMMSPGLSGTPDWNLGKIAREAIEMDVYLVPLIKSNTNKTLIGVVKLEGILEKIAECCGKRPKVREIMTEDVITFQPEDRISIVWNRMEETNITGIPITNNGKTIGMITKSDILKSGRARLAVESESGRTPPKIKTIMNTPPITISPHASIGEAAKTMKKQNIGRIPITKDKRLIGIVDREDLIKPYL